MRKVEEIIQGEFNIVGWMDDLSDVEVIGDYITYT